MIIAKSKKPKQLPTCQSLVTQRTGIRGRKGNGRRVGMLLLFILISMSGGVSSSWADEDWLFFASGVKVGEVDQDSAIVWVRLTEDKEADFELLPILTEGLKPKESSDVEMPRDVVPGMSGKVRLKYWQAGQEAGQRTTPWQSARAESDFVVQFELSGLASGATYEYQVEGVAADRTGQRGSIQGQFQTAPPVNKSQPVRFIVSTCQAVRSIDAGKEGHVSYQRMLDFNPMFFVHTGDIVYYDKVPLARNKEAARAKWNLMFSYGHNREFHRNVSSYFMKDDHDTLKNDCWPGQRYGDLTFEQGLEIFREQVPMGAQTFRTVRWGKDVQIWMTENRDFRSSNRMKDGPQKTILGADQKAWLKKTLKESDATFKFVISPGPLVGPDKKGKNDNHSNPGFTTEGEELREFLSGLENCYVICGDRHWQYCSRDPETGLIEMGCGPINDQHSFGGNPGRYPDFHRYFSAKGGFLGITVDGSSARAEWFGTNDRTPSSKVLHTERLPLPEE
ncbi:MAG: alkaline phosphatase D family protein [Planctomycetota bacterium]|nr:alkaline phosphatase D family protein [Planctomycetota bacterium]